MQDFRREKERDIERFECGRKFKAEKKEFARDRIAAHCRRAPEETIPREERDREMSIDRTTTSRAEKFLAIVFLPVSPVGTTRRTVKSARE